MATPGKPVLSDPTETAFHVSWDPVPQAVKYKICVVEFPKKWEEAQQIILVETPNLTHSHIEDRFPTSTYLVRIVAVFEDGTESPPGPETVIDTAVANCAPGEKKKTCEIM